MKPLNNVRSGTLGGTLCSLGNTLDWTTLIDTAVVAAIGAAVSYIVSRLLDRRHRRWRR